MLVIALILSHGSVLPVDGFLALDAVDAGLTVEWGGVTGLPEPPIDAITPMQLVERTVLATARAKSFLRQKRNTTVTSPRTYQMAAHATMQNHSSSVNFTSCHLP
jgi:hypothetical protein